MPSNETSWTTVSAKAKTKVTTTAAKSSGTSAMPKAEVKNIKLSDSAFSAMKDRIEATNDENDIGDKKIQKTVSNNEKQSQTKVTKPNKSTSNSLTLKQALQNIDVEKFKQTNKLTKDNSSLWMEKICYWFIEQFKEVTSGLNDPTFSKETNEDYPLSSLSSSFQYYLKQLFDTQSKLKAITLCRNGILSSNSDNYVIVGYQVLLQYFLRNLGDKPKESFLDEVDELSASFKRYPSDKVLRLIWSYSQIQYEYPGLALEVWFRLMLPLIENRTYNQFAVENLSQITTRCAKNKRFLQSSDALPIESYVKLLDFIDRPHPALTREMRTTIAKSANTLSELFNSNTKNLAQHSNSYFEILFAQVSTDKQRSQKNQSIIDQMILACLTDKSIIKTWLSLHKTYPESSLYLLSLLHTNETKKSSSFTSKELNNISRQLQTISNEIIQSNDDDRSIHQEFINAYSNNAHAIVTKNKKRSKSKLGSILKLFIILGIAFTIYNNWLWLTVATDYLLEDYLKHPTAIVIKEQLSKTCVEAKKISFVAMKQAQEFVRSSMTNIEPYVIKFGQYLQKQWLLLLKYIEGPIYDKSVEVAEQIQKLSIIIFTRSVHYLNIFFDLASQYTARLTMFSQVYFEQFYEFIYDKWINFDATYLKEKFNEMRTRLVKSI